MIVTIPTRLFRKERLEALSDGVFAIVMTLLVLDLAIPHAHSGSELRAALMAEKALFFSYALTFSIAAEYWMLQHGIFEALDEAGEATAKSTFVFLALISVLPFTTALLGSNGDFRLSFVLYLGGLSLAALALAATLEIARWKKQLQPQASLAYLRFRTYRNAALMLTAVVSLSFIEPRRIWIPLFGASIVARALRYFLRRKGFAV